MVVGDGKQKVPKGGETGQGSLVDPGIILALDLGKGRVCGARAKMFAAEGVIDTIVNAVEPVAEGGTGREVDWVLFIVVGEAGAAVFTGQNVGDGVEKGLIVVAAVGCI